MDGDILLSLHSILLCTTNLWREREREREREGGGEGGNNMGGKKYIIDSTFLTL